MTQVLLILAITASISWNPKEENNSEFQNQEDCEYENSTKSLGRGLIILPENYKLYSDSSLTKSICNSNMYESENNSPQICSKFCKPDYGIMHMICLGKGSGYYKVLYNFSKIAYVPRNENYKSKSWNNYILDSYGIRRKLEQKTPNHVRSRPSLSGEEIKIPDGHELFCPMEVKGDWVKVQYDCFYNSKENPFEGEPCSSYIKECGAGITGWIQWKKGANLLIDIFLMA